jgi:hypothetical protein
MSDYIKLFDNKQQRPASEFPRHADVYLCDQCQRDITKYLHPAKAHSWQALGSERYRCQCGQIYKTGAKEWKHLSDWEKRRRIQQTFGFGSVILVFFSVATLVVYFAFHLMHLRIFNLAFALAISLSPSLIFVGSFCIEIAASLWRTRKTDLAKI